MYVGDEEECVEGEVPAMVHVMDLPVDVKNRLRDGGACQGVDMPV